MADKRRYVRWVMSEQGYTQGQLNSIRFANEITQNGTVQSCIDSDSWVYWYSPIDGTLIRDKLGYSDSTVYYIPDSYSVNVTTKPTASNLIGAFNGDLRSTFTPGTLTVYVDGDEYLSYSIGDWTLGYVPPIGEIIPETTTLTTSTATTYPAGIIAGTSEVKYTHVAADIIDKPEGSYDVAGINYEFIPLAVSRISIDSSYGDISATLDSFTTFKLINEYGIENIIDKVEPLDFVGGSTRVTTTDTLSTIIANLSYTTWLLPISKDAPK